MAVDALSSTSLPVFKRRIILAFCYCVVFLLLYFVIIMFHKMHVIITQE